MKRQSSRADRGPPRPGPEAEGGEAGPLGLSSVRGFGAPSAERRSGARNGTTATVPNGIVRVVVGEADNEWLPRHAMKAREASGAPVVTGTTPAATEEADHAAARSVMMPPNGSPLQHGPAQQAATPLRDRARWGGRHAGRAGESPHRCRHGAGDRPPVHRALFLGHDDDVAQRLPASVTAAVLVATRHQRHLPRRAADCSAASCSHDADQEDPVAECAASMNSEVDTVRAGR